MHTCQIAISIEQLDKTSAKGVKLALSDTINKTAWAVIKISEPTALLGWHAAAQLQLRHRHANKKQDDTVPLARRNAKRVSIHWGINQHQQDLNPQQSTKEGDRSVQRHRATIAPRGTPHEDCPSLTSPPPFLLAVLIVGTRVSAGTRVMPTDQGGQHGPK